MQTGENIGETEGIRPVPGTPGRGIPGDVSAKSLFSGDELGEGWHTQDRVIVKTYHGGARHGGVGEDPKTQEAGRTQHVTAFQ